jgi:hypothetical protein
VKKQKPKSKRPKLTNKTSQNNHTVSIRSSPDMLGGKFKSFVTRFFNVIIFLGTLLPILLWIFYWYLDPLGRPDIHPNSGQVSDPFDLRFSIKNNSKAFQLTVTSISCRVIKFELDNDGKIENNTINQRRLSLIVAQNKSVQYNCPFNSMIQLPGQVQTAQVSIDINYSLFGFDNTATSEIMTWTRQSGQWIEGSLIN